MQFIEDFENEKYIYEIFEYAEGGDLWKFLTKKAKRNNDEIKQTLKMNESDAFSYFQQIISALAHIHRLKIYHLDIKPENILLDKTQQKAKLSDFGLATREAALCEIKGTTEYMPPEMVLQLEYQS